MIETLVQDSSKTGRIEIWPNSDFLLTHDEIDSIIQAFRRLKREYTSEEIEENNNEIRRQIYKPNVLDKAARHWRRIRIDVLDRDDRKCTKCGSEDNLQVHHLTYKNEGTEVLEDLLTLCRSCHAKMKTPRRPSKRYL